MNKKQIILVILSIPSIIAVYFVNEQYLNAYLSATDSQQLLITAGFTSVIGLLIHFIKKYHRFEPRQYQMIFELFEIFMLMITPVLASFELLKEIFPHQILPIMIPFVAMLFLWYLVMLFITCNPKHAKEGNAAFVISTMIYWLFLFMSIPFVGLGIVLGNPP